MATWVEFTNGQGVMGSIPGRIIPEIFIMVLDTALLNTQQYKLRIKVKVEKSEEGSSALPYTSVLLKRSLLVAPDYGRQLHLFVPNYK